MTQALAASKGLDSHLSGGERPLNPKHLAMGEVWARTFSEHPLTDTQLQAVALAYARLLAEPRTQVFHHLVEGRTVVLVQLGRELQVVDRGQLWAWSLEDQMPPDRPRALTADTLWQAHRSHLESQAGVWKEGSWLLHSFCQAAHTLAKSWAEQDLRLAFRHAGVEGGPEAYCSDPDDPHKMRRIKGYSARTRFYLACIGTALRPLREALPREVRRTLWAIRCPKGWLAHWVLSAASEKSQLYRCQALRVQPLLLPQVLYGLSSRRSLKNEPEAVDPSLNFALEQVLKSMIKMLDECVDLGSPFHQPLLDILSILKTYDSQALYQEFNMPAWSRSDFRFLSGKPIHQTLTFAQVNRHHTYELAPAMVKFVRHLEPVRRPRTPKDWNVVYKLVEGIIRVAREHSQKPFYRSEAFLKGCPVRWDDPFYAKIEHMLLRIDEAVNEFTPTQMKPECPLTFIAEVMGHLSFRQWINLTEHFYQIERAHDVETHEHLLVTDTLYRRTHEDLMLHCKWPASLRQGCLIHGPLRIHELINLNDTRDEGLRMDHCVGNSEYALGCAEGQWRLFSFRDAITDAPISTVQLSWDAAQRKFFVLQHLGIGDTPPPREAIQALRALLRSDQLTPGPWPINRKVRRLRKGLELIELKTRQQDLTLLGKRLWNDVWRRYPHLIPAIASF